MDPMSRLTGGIDTEQRRVELFELVSAQRNVVNHLTMRAPAQQIATVFRECLTTRLRELAHFGPGWRTYQVTSPAKVD